MLTFFLRLIHRGIGFLKEFLYVCDILSIHDPYAYLNRRNTVTRLFQFFVYLLYL